MTTEIQVRDRTKLFGLRCIKMALALPKTDIGRIVGKQLMRASTSVGANYRAACRARSDADFINKLGIVEEETDESMYWMEIIIESDLLPESRISSLKKEANEILSIIIASRKTASNRKSKIKNQKFP